MSNHPTTSSPTTSSPATTSTDGARKAYLSVIGLAGVIILLQAVWAGLFIREGEDYQAGWVTVHARGAEVAIGLSVVAAVIAFVKMRERKDLLIGAGAMALILVLEAYVGGLIGAQANLTVVHIPLGMALMGLAVWLPMRATRR